MPIPFVKGPKAPPYEPSLRERVQYHLNMAIMYAQLGAHELAHQEIVEHDALLDPRPVDRGRELAALARLDAKHEDMMKNQPPHWGKEN